MAKNLIIIEKEIFGEVVKVDKEDGVPVHTFGRRKPKDNPEDAPEIPVLEPQPRARKTKPLKPPETIADQLSQGEAPQT